MNTELSSGGRAFRSLSQGQPSVQEAGSDEAAIFGIQGDLKHRAALPFRIGTGTVEHRVAQRKGYAPTGVMLQWL